MASNEVFLRGNDRGWRTGFANLLRKEMRDWWGTRRWLTRSIMWLAMINGIVAIVLLASDEGASAIPLGVKAVTGLAVFFAFGSIAVSIGTTITGQGEILDEKRSGTAAWILSKPVARIAFILSKLISNAISILIIMILLQGAVAFILITSITGAKVSVSGFLAALGVLYLAVMFYFSLALMLGTISGKRGAAIGIPIVILFSYQFVLPLAPWMGQIMPWLLTTSLGSMDSSIALALTLGQPVTSITPIIATLAWCVLFIIIAMWRFNREEF
ncbi:MAG TPA: ABC transporter permease subunit [Anaerolineae bacterium]|nr:ABC transporter permease subunit [Anaerolineae bacterium]